MVRKAVMDDFPVILNIYATARAFMAKTGNPTQWAGGHPSAVTGICTIEVFSFA